MPTELLPVTATARSGEALRLARLQRWRRVLQAGFFALFLLAPALDLLRFDLHEAQLWVLGQRWTLGIAAFQRGEITANEVAISILLRGIVLFGAMTALMLRFVYNSVRMDVAVLPEYGAKWAAGLRAAGALAGTIDGSGEQASTDTPATLIRADHEIVDLDHLVRTAAFQWHQAGHQHRYGENPELALGDQQGRAGRLQPGQHLIAGMRPVVQELAQLLGVTRPGQPHADRQWRRCRFQLCFDDRHLVLRFAVHRGPEARSRNEEAAGSGGFRQVMTIRAAYVSDVKYQPFWSRFMIMGIL